MAENPRKITKIVDGGPHLSGEEIMFIAQFETGDTEEFRCRQESLPHIFTNLQNYARAAQHLRATRPKLKEGDGYDDVWEPFKLRNHQVGSATRTVGVKLIVEEGFPVQVAMTPDQAKTLAVKLIEQAQRAESGQTQTRKQ